MTFSAAVETIATPKSAVTPTISVPALAQRQASRTTLSVTALVVLGLASRSLTGGPKRSRWPAVRFQETGALIRQPHEGKNTERRHRHRLRPRLVAGAEQL